MLSAVLSAGMLAAALPSVPVCAVSEGGAQTDNYYFVDDFESGAGEWSGRGAASVAASTEAFSGSGSLFVSGRTAAWNGAVKALDSSFAAGSDYSFSANVMYKTGAKTVTFYLKIQFKNVAGETSYDGIAEVTTVKGMWAQLENTSYTLPEGATDIQLYVETADGTVDFYVDDVCAAVPGTKTEGAGGSKAIVRGDTDFNGTINAVDISLLRSIVVNGTATEAVKSAADIDGNGEVEINDVVLAQEFVLGMISEFPEPPKPDNKWDDYAETASAQWIDFYQSSICNMGNTYRLTKKLEAAENGEGLTLTYIGGSITEGKNYSRPFTAYVKDTFANGSFTEVNAGISGTSSVVGLVRSEADIVSKEPDIVVIEFSVNDHEDILYKKSLESMAKKFLELPNEPAVIILINRAKGGFSSQEQMEKIGKNLDVPVISMNNALTKAFNSGLLQTSDYFTDEYHPHEQGGQLIADCMAYYLRQAMKTENRSDSYEIPTTAAYGTEYVSCRNVDPKTLTGFNAGSWTAGTGYSSLPFGYTSSGGSPMTFKVNAKGFIVVFKANASGMGSINVTVNGKTTKIDGNKLYTWGGPDAELGYYQDTAGDLDVSISASGSFTIWGLGIVE
jgi:lysophospholipase L1-like esterase